MSAAASLDWELAMTERLWSLRHDPLGAVLYGFPWGEGELASSAGPWKWQAGLLEDVGKHLRNPETRHTVGKFAVSSGHGIGKSATVAQLTWWATSTFPDTRVILTANTKTQLDTKTQPEVSKWFRMAMNSADFEVNVASIKVRDSEHERNWRADFIPWSEENPQAFAGAHNAGKRLLIICDEASEISDMIYEVVQGALTDANTEILWFMFGNPTRNVGYFYDACFGKMRHRWNVRHIDAREVEGTNKAEIQEAIDDYGEDSDFVRVRYRGLPPRAGSGQFIDLERIAKAQGRAVRVLADEPVIVGVDFAWGGDDDNVVRFRRGLDARSIPPIKVKGEFTRDPAVMTQKLGEILTKVYSGQRIAMMFLDSAGIAGPVAARLRALGHRNVMEVNFGADSPDPSKTAYFRDYMWTKMRDWLLEGAIDKDPGLEADLSAPLLVSDPKQRIKLESKDLMKKRLKKMGKAGDSPDDGDALALTFAMPVLPKKEHKPAVKRNFSAWG